MVLPGPELISAKQLISEKGERMNTPTETLIKALRILANDIQSEDSVANAAILEAAQRMEEDQEVIFQAGESIKILRQTVKHRNETIDELKQRIKRLEEAIDAYQKAYTSEGHKIPHDCFATGPCTGDPIQDLVMCPGCWAEQKAKEAKP